MFRKVICSVSFVLLLSLSSNVSADVSWNDSTPDKPEGCFEVRSH